MSAKERAKNPRILIVTPEITYLPEGMGNLAGKMSAKAGGMADVSASLVQALMSASTSPRTVASTIATRSIRRVTGI